jgi:hypothetical protein
MALSPPLVPGAVAAAIRPRGYLFFAPTLSIRLTRESGPAGTLMLSDHRPELGRGSPCFSRGAHMLLRLIGLEGLNYASKRIFSRVRAGPAPGAKATALSQRCSVQDFANDGNVIECAPSPLLVEETGQGDSI